MVNERDLRPSLPQIPRRAHAQIERTPQQRTSGANWRCTLRSGRERWCRLGDLNTRPSHYECDALPAELRRHGGRDRIDASGPDGSFSRPDITAKPRTTQAPRPGPRQGFLAKASALNVG